MLSSFIQSYRVYSPVALIYMHNKIGGLFEKEASREEFTASYGVVCGDNDAPNSLLRSDGLLLTGG